MILGSEIWPQTVSQLASWSHMFYISGGKSIDKNISLSYWFVIDYCFLITQWLMIIFVLWPWRPHELYFNSPHILSFMAESIIKLAWIQFRHLHLGVMLVPWSSSFTELLCLVSHSPARITLSQTLLVEPDSTDYKESWALKNWFFRTVVLE